MWESDVESAATEHDECYEVGDVVEAVGHADGDLDAVVGRLEPGVGVAELDGPEDVRAPSPDPPREFDYLGDTVVGRPEHPMVQFRLGLVAHQPRALGLEVAREPAARFRPRHPGDHDAALRAVHARHGGDQFDPSSSRNPGHTSSARRRPGHTRGASFRSGSIGACPRTWAHMDLEDGSGAQWRVDDARVLDHRVFDVEKPVEYPVHQALCGCLFILVENILPGKRSSLTPSTTQRRNPPTKTAIAPHKSYSGDERIAYVEPVSWRIAEAVSALSIIAIVATVAVPRISR